MKKQTPQYSYIFFVIIIAVLIIYIIFYKLLRKRYNSFQSTTKKVAFCFLINKEINNEDIWYEYLKLVDKAKYNIYIHYKENKPLKYFENYRLEETIDTCWGCLSIVHAQNLILKEALKDSENQHFIWLSESCIPLKTFDHIYNYLNIQKSYFNIAPDNQVFPRAKSVLKYIKKENVKKAAMPAIINRKHAQLFVDNNENIKIWFANINNVDEIVYITLLFHNNCQDELVLTQNISAGAIIFTGWPDMVNYKLFNQSKLLKTSPNEYTYICPEELNYLIKSNSLFARKFIKKCDGLTNLNSLLHNIQYVL